MPNTPEQAIQKAAALKDGPKFGAGLCLRMVRTCYGVPAQAPDATAAWVNAKLKHRTTDPDTIPRGAPIFWTGGSQGHGHIAIATGNGHCWSTDILRPGYFDHVPIDLIRTKWGLPLVGWTEDLNSVRVWTKPTEPAKEATVPLAHQRVVNDMNDRHLANLDNISAAQKTGIQPYADAADDYHDAVQLAWDTYKRRTATK